MAFLNLRFYIFLIALLLLLYNTKKEKNRQNIILVFCVLFYIFNAGKALIVAAFDSAIAFFIARRISKTKNVTLRKLYLFAGVIINILVLCLFKYNDFYINTISLKFGMDESTLSLVMPIGISFYTFKLVGYMVDIYRKDISDAYSIRDVFLYSMFFPQILSGPIEGAKDFLEDLENEHKISFKGLENGASRMMVGLFKKIVVADRIGACVDSVYSAPLAYSSLSVWLCVIGYSIQLYCDFSGYSDMAIGCGNMLGYNCKENFDFPYFSKTFKEFWRRWHISLSSWLTNYVYIPLGGSKKGKIRTYLNIFITMIVSGLWHGSGIVFVIWGFGHACLMVMERIPDDLTAAYENAKYSDKEDLEEDVEDVYSNIIWKIMEAIYTAFVFLVVTLLWVPFRAGTIEKTDMILYKIFTISEGIRYVPIYIIVYGCILFIVSVYMYKKSGGHRNFDYINLRTFKGKLLFAFLFVITVCMAYIGDGAFIYANF